MYYTTANVVTKTKKDSSINSLVNYFQRCIMYSY